jgi:ribonucleoside-triphosphate reductase (formate)
MKTDAYTLKQETPNEEEVKIPCEVYSRIVGYLRPIQNWNEGKQQEFKERKTFRVTERTTR